MTDSPRRQARSFGTAAERYDRYRPGYAREAVAWAVGERPLRIADLGAGTGILSRLLRRLGHEVIAVEPDDQMRARLTEVSPGIRALAGAAEQIPLPDGSVDAVVAGQAYHWFDRDRAHPEIARVLRPGGVFAAMRNDPDPDTPWTVRFAEIIDGAAPTGGSPPVPDFGERFGPVEPADFRHELRLTREDLVGVASTRSPYLVATPEGQRELVEAVRRLITETGLPSGEPFPMPYLTRVRRATLR